jgi:ABC-2 type transport system permease protein
MTTWWAPGDDNLLLIAAFPLALGAIFGGASFAGAEWKAGTVTSVLTWEPRRGRVFVARLVAAFVLATVIGFVLTALFLLAALPAVLVNGTAAGADADWWISLAAAVGRISVLVGLTAALAAGLATLARGTTFALGATFAWMAIVEPLVREWKPSAGRHLIGENLSIALTWAQLDTANFTRSPVMASLVTAGYCGVVVLASAVLSLRRDIAGSS